MCDAFGSLLCMLGMLPIRAVPCLRQHWLSELLFWTLPGKPQLAAADNCLDFGEGWLEVDWAASIAILCEVTFVLSVRSGRDCNTLQYFKPEIQVFALFSSCVVKLELQVSCRGTTHPFLSEVLKNYASSKFF